MRRMILGAVAVLAAAAALAGCGGSGSASGQGATASGSGGVSTSGVAGAQTVQGSATFSANAKGLANRIQSTVKSFANGNVGGAAAGAASLLQHCTQTVNGKLAPHASTQSQQAVVTHLRNACQDLQKASSKAANGNTTTAQNLARQAVRQARQAVKQLH